MMTSATGNMMKVAAAAFVVVVMAAGAAFADDGKDGGETFDWLRMENGRIQSDDGFATADPELAAVFVPTGRDGSARTITLTIAGATYRAVLRGGRYYSNEENPDTSMDIPASAEVFGEDGRRLFAAKGYKFIEARKQDDGNGIVIRYYRGVMGCGLIDYHLLPSGKNLTLTKAQIISTKDYSPCQTK
ncbi:MAG: hypothetical protein ACR2P4_08110 [Gammaproteobacteria bacterium]